MQNRKPNEMSQALFDKVAEIYGRHALSDKNTTANRILCVRELNEREKAIASSNLTVQSLYKINAPLKFFRLNHVFSKWIAGNEILRSNFFIVADLGFAVVFNGRNSLPEIVCQNMQKLDKEELASAINRLMDADKRRSFDLKKGNLIRLTILHTDETEYAILVTMSQLLGETFNVEEFLAEVLEIASSDSEKQNADAYSDYLISKPQVESSLRQYWTKILADLPVAQQLPYYKPSTELGLQYSYRVVIPYEVVDRMRSYSQSNRLMLMTMLQTAWGLMIQEFNQSDDAAFCSLMPSRDQSSAFNTIPVRLKSSGDSTVGQLVKTQFQQLIVSQPYGRMNWAALEEISYSSHAFDHFLSFTDFMTERKSFNQIEMTAALELVSRRFWNAQDSRLGIYFTFDNDELAAVLKYDEQWLTPGEAMLLMKKYLSTLNGMITGWDIPVAAVKDQLRYDLGLRETPEDSRSILQNAVSKMELLQGINEGTLQHLVNVSRLEMRFEGDRIFGEELEKNIILVEDGMLARSIDTGDGWFNMLDMAVPGLPINETALLDERKFKISAEVVSEQATLLIIPLDAMNRVLKQSPHLWQNIARHALTEVENYQSIWVQD